MVRLRFSGLLLFVGLVVACGGGKTGAVRVPAAEPAAAPALAATPLTPVAAPAGVFAVVRVRSVARLADTAVAWAALPVDWRRLVGEEAPGVLDVVDVDAPVDLVAQLDPGSGMEPRVLWAFAVGARSADAVAAFFRSKGEKVIEESRGAYRIQVGSDLVCRAAPARGRAPARLVCSEDAERTAALSPYMTRGLPEESFGDQDVHAHVLAEPFRRQYGAQLPLLRTVGVPFVLREISVDDPKLDRALRDAAYSIADELIALGRDVGRLDLELSLPPAGDAIEANVSLGFVGRTSWSAGNLARAAITPAAPAPEAFFRLPGDAVGAGYSTFAEPERARPVAEGISRLVDAYLEYVQVPEVRRAALTRALEATLTSGKGSRYATMNVPPLPLGKDATEAAKTRSTMRSAVGMHLFAIDEAGTAVLDLASELVKLSSDRALRSRFAKAIDLPEDHLPTAVQRVPRGKGTPPGTKVFEFQIPAALLEPKTFGTMDDAAGPSRGTRPASGKTKVLAKKKEPPFSVLFVIAPDGPVTWAAMGTDEKGLLARVAAARAGSGPVLAGRPGLEVLRSEPAVSGGFATLAATLAGLSAEEFGAPPLDRLPSRGETPMVWTVKVDSIGPRLHMKTRVPKAVVEDLVAWTSSLGAGLLPSR
jgi:hypothetical protein